MIESAETIRLKMAKERLTVIQADLRSVESQLSFVQGDDLFETAADSVANELTQTFFWLGKLQQWVDAGVETMIQIDKELAERRTNSA